MQNAAHLWTIGVPVTQEVHQGTLFLWEFDTQCLQIGNKIISEELACVIFAYFSSTLIASTTTILKSSEISEMNPEICFINRSTELSVLRKWVRIWTIQSRIDKPQTTRKWQVSFPYAPCLQQGGDSQSGNREVMIGNQVFHVQITRRNLFC